MFGLEITELSFVDTSRAFPILQEISNWNGKIQNSEVLNKISFKIDINFNLTEFWSF